jgi:hypothetical protein
VDSEEEEEDPEDSEEEEEETPEDSEEEEEEVVSKLIRIEEILLPLKEPKRNCRK